MRPNIVFLFPDQWRGDWFGDTEIGTTLRTPTLSELAKEGVTCSQAFTPSPLCAPARACIASGMEYPACGVVNNAMDFPTDVPTVYRQLRDGGYHVMGCGKFDLHKASYSWGREGTHLMDDWGFSDGIDNEGKVDGVVSYSQHKIGPYMDFLEKRGKALEHIDDFAARGTYGTDPTTLTEDEYCDNWVTDNALKLLTRAPEETPWFLQVNFTGPHDPFDVTKDMHSWYEATDFPHPFGQYKEAIDHLSIRRNYAAMMENIDRNINRILSHPRIQEDRENTIIVFASDHGDMLGDHGFYEKHLPYNGATHVPLILSGGGIERSDICSTPITILDLPATFLDLAGLPQEAMPSSKTLLPLLESDTIARPIITSGLYEDNNPLRQWRMALNSTYKYIIWFDGREALYALEDYQEAHNLIEQFPLEALELKQFFEGKQ